MKWGKLNRLVKTHGKGRRWAPGTSSASNPRVTKHRVAAAAQAIRAGPVSTKPVVDTSGKASTVPRPNPSVFGTSFETDPNKDRMELDEVDDNDNMSVISGISVFSNISNVTISGALQSLDSSKPFHRKIMGVVASAQTLIEESCADSKLETPSQNPVPYLAAVTRMLMESLEDLKACLTNLQFLDERMDPTQQKSDSKYPTLKNDNDAVCHDDNESKRERLEDDLKDLVETCSAIVLCINMLLPRVAVATARTISTSKLIPACDTIVQLPDASPLLIAYTLRLLGLSLTFLTPSDWTSSSAYVSSLLTLITLSDNQNGQANPNAVQMAIKSLKRIVSQGYLPSQLVARLFGTSLKLQLAQRDPSPKIHAQNLVNRIRLVYIFLPLASFDQLKSIAEVCLGLLSSESDRGVVLSIYDLLDFPHSCSTNFLKASAKISASQWSSLLEPLLAALLESKGPVCRIQRTSWINLLSSLAEGLSRVNPEIWISAAVTHILKLCISEIALVNHEERFSGGSTSAAANDLAAASKRVAFAQIGLIRHNHSAEDRELIHIEPVVSCLAAMFFSPVYCDTLKSAWTIVLKLVKELIPICDTDDCGMRKLLRRLILWRGNLSFETLEALDACISCACSSYDLKSWLFISPTEQNSYKLTPLNLLDHVDWLPWKLTKSIQANQHLELSIWVDFVLPTIEAIPQTASGDDGGQSSMEADDDGPESIQRIGADPVAALARNRRSKYNLWSTLPAFVSGQRPPSDLSTAFPKIAKRLGTVLADQSHTNDDIALIVLNALQKLLNVTTGDGSAAAEHNDSENEGSDADDDFVDDIDEQQSDEDIALRVTSLLRFGKNFLPLLFNRYLGGSGDKTSGGGTIHKSMGSYTLRIETLHCMSGWAKLCHAAKGMGEPHTTVATTLMSKLMDSVWSKFDNLDPPNAPSLNVFYEQTSMGVSLIDIARALIPGLSHSHTMKLLERVSNWLASPQKVKKRSAIITEKRLTARWWDRLEKRAFRILETLFKSTIKIEENEAGNKQEILEHISSIILEQSQSQISALPQACLAPRTRCLLLLVEELFNNETTHTNGLSSSAIQSILGQSLAGLRQVNSAGRRAAATLFLRLVSKLASNPDGEIDDAKFTNTLSLLKEPLGHPETARVAARALAHAIRFFPKRHFESAFVATLLCPSLDAFVSVSQQAEGSLPDSPKQIRLDILLMLKYAATRLNPECVGVCLSQIMRATCGLSDDENRPIRFALGHLMTKLVSRFGHEEVRKVTPQNHLRHLHAVAKASRKKTANGGAGNSDEEGRDESVVMSFREAAMGGGGGVSLISAKTRATNVTQLTREFSRFLAAGSEDDESDYSSTGWHSSNDDHHHHKPTPTPSMATSSRRNKAANMKGMKFKEDLDNLLNLDDPQSLLKASVRMASESSQIRSQQKESSSTVKDGGFRTNAEGKLIIEEPGSSNVKKTSRKRVMAEELNFDSSDEDDEDAKPMGPPTSVARKGKVQNKAKPLGSEYKATKAKGDITKKGRPAPFAYVPLTRVNKRNKKAAMNPKHALKQVVGPTAKRYRKN